MWLPPVPSVPLSRVIMPWDLIKSLVLQVHQIASLSRWIILGRVLTIAVIFGAQSKSSNRHLTCAQAAHVCHLQTKERKIISLLFSDGYPPGVRAEILLHRQPSNQKILRSSCFCAHKDYLYLKFPLLVKSIIAGFVDFSARNEG